MPDNESIQALTAQIEEAFDEIALENIEIKVAELKKRVEEALAMDSTESVNGLMQIPSLQDEYGNHLEVVLLCPPGEEERARKALIHMRVMIKQGIELRSQMLKNATKVVLMQTLGMPEDLMRGTLADLDSTTIRNLLRKVVLTDAILAAVNNEEEAMRTNVATYYALVGEDALLKDGGPDV